jgi:uncharacterized protein YbjT (DUF2867 family)
MVVVHGVALTRSMTNYLVLGGTGKTGRRVITQLVAAGHTARAAARTPGPASPGVDPVRFDWADSSTYAPALAGVDAVYVVPPALQLDHAEQIAALGTRALDLGVDRAVMLSARGADQAPGSPLFRSEQALIATGLPTGVVRPSWFAQNFTESFFAPAISTDGVIVAPSGEGAHAFIDAEDIAAVAVALLTAQAPLGAYDISGPRALSFGEAAAILSPHAGRAVKHVDLPVYDWKAGAAQNGLPADYAELLGMLFTLIRDGHDAEVSDGVQRALGRDSTAFEDWAAREAGSLR